MNVRQVIFVVMAFLVAVLSGNAENVRHDGNWWRSQTQSAKYHYVAGCLDGVTVGSNFLEFGMSTEISFKTEISNSYNTPGQTNIHITGVQLVGGLDKLYSDDRNSSIAVSNAVSVILHGAAGAPQGDLIKMIEQYRKPGC
jgi:hypothetical protein